MSISSLRRPLTEPRTGLDMSNFCFLCERYPVPEDAGYELNKDERKIAQRINPIWVAVNRICNPCVRGIRESVERYSKLDTAPPDAEDCGEYFEHHMTPRHTTQWFGSNAQLANSRQWTTIDRVNKDAIIHGCDRWILYGSDGQFIAKGLVRTS